MPKIVFINISPFGSCHCPRDFWLKFFARAWPQSTLTARWVVGRQQGKCWVQATTRRHRFWLHHSALCI